MEQAQGSSEKLLTILWLSDKCLDLMKIVS